MGKMKASGEAVVLVVGSAELVRVFKDPVVSDEPADTAQFGFNEKYLKSSARESLILPGALQLFFPSYPCILMFQVIYSLTMLLYIFPSGMVRVTNSGASDSSTTFGHSIRP